MTPKKLYVLRAFLFAFGAAIATVKASIGDGIDTGEWIDVANASYTTFMTYLGLGALTPLEPNVGVKKSEIVEGG